MTKLIVTRSRRSIKDFTRDEWVLYCYEFLEMRRGLAGASEHESLVGYIDGFKPVYVLPGKALEGETWYVWLIFPGEGRNSRVVNKLLDGVYSDAQNGDVYEHPPEWTLVVGTVSRIGDEPLLTSEMLRGV